MILFCHLIDYGALCSYVATIITLLLLFLVVDDDDDQYGVPLLWYSHSDTCHWSTISKTEQQMRPRSVLFFFLALHSLSMIAVSLFFSLPICLFTWKCTMLIIIINAPKYSANCTRVRTVRQFPFESQSKSVSYHMPLKWASLRASSVRGRTTDTILPHFIVIQSISNQHFHDHCRVSLYRSDNESSIEMDFPLFSSFSWSTANRSFLRTNC